MKRVFGVIVFVSVLVGGIFLFPFKNSPAVENEPGDLAETAEMPEHAVSAAEPTAVPLLISGASEAVLWNSTTPAAHRARIISPNPDLLNPVPVLRVGDRIELALFDDAVLAGEIGDVSVYPNGAVGMTAKLDREIKGTLYLAYCGGELRSFADVRGGNDFYVRYDPATKQHIALEMDRSRSDIQEGGEPLVPELHGVPVGDEISNKPAMILPPHPARALADGAPDTTQIDVMIVYTPAAKAAEGGLSGINNNIALAMQLANDVHGNSDSKMVLNLVHSAETVYTESGSPSTDLYNLTHTGSSYTAMDEVHTLRNTYSADFICLLESEPGTGGLGWLLTSATGAPDLAFCLARVQQSDFTYTVVHEWGHNMGCSHSKTQTSQPWESDDFSSYSAGWQWADAGSLLGTIGYCSVMTYENFDNNPYNENEYERAPHFSNPNISFGANPTGNAADGDNARVLREIRYTAADYRISAAVVSSFPSSNSFEQAFSPWNYYGGTASWQREDGTNPNLVNNAPNIATTTAADGSIYLMVDGYTSSAGDSAILSATFDFSGISDPDISFSYCMYSAWGFEAVTTLQVSTNNGAVWQSLWSNSGKPNNNWYRDTVSLNAFVGQSNVIVRFKSDIGANWYKNYPCLDNIVVDGTAAVNPDIDGDGIPNDWELLYFGGTTNAVATANPDGDLFNNLQEYIAGLNPNVWDSFAISNLTFGANPGFEWSAKTGRLYSVYWSSNLLTGFALIQSNLTSGAFTDTEHGAESESFYKLEVEVAP